jgi:hypothetical protein
MRIVSTIFRLDFVGSGSVVFFVFHFTLPEPTKSNRKIVETIRIALLYLPYRGNSLLYRPTLM